MKCPKTCGFCSCNGSTTSETEPLAIEMNVNVPDRNMGSTVIRGNELLREGSELLRSQQITQQLRQARHKEKPAVWITDQDIEDAPFSKNIAEVMQHMGLIWLLILSLASGMVTCGLRRRRSTSKSKRKARELRFLPLAQ